MGNYIQKIASLLIVACILSISNLHAQAPLGFNYQGVALTNAGTPVASKKISLRISLIESQQLGSITYQETHGVNTDAYGQFSIIIGNGQAVTGKMTDAQWSKFPYYMKVELDLDGGTSFVFVGTSQLLSVPFALYANNAGAASISVDSVKNELATIKLSQKGDSIILSNNRGSVYVPKVDSLTKILAQISSIKAGTIKSIKDSISKLPNGIAIGYNALNNFDSIAFNSSNIAMGQSAGVALIKQTSGISNSDNILVGQNAAASINGTSTSTGAYQNIIIGNGAGQSTNALASQNVVIGHEAAKNSNGTIGTKTSVFNSNIAIGARSLKSAIISQSNVSIGVDNMNATTQANRNTMIGSNAVNKYNGDDNVIIGAEMLFDTSSNGSKNVIIGSIVARNIRGSKNIIIGYKAAYDTSFLNTNNKLIISNDSTRTPLIYGEFDNKKVTINGDLTVTGKLNGSTGSSVSDSTIKVLNKRIDSLVTAISTKTYARIDSSTLAKINPVVATKFLDSTFLPTINFDGSTTRILAGSNNLFGIKGSFTVETWVKNLLTSTSSQTIFGTGYNYAEDQGGKFSLKIRSGRLIAVVGNSNQLGILTIGCDLPNDSLWHHVMFNVDDINKVSRLYVDGFEKTKLPYTTLPDLTLNNSPTILGFGANLINGADAPLQYFKGNLRKLRVSKGAVYTSNFTPSYTYTKSDSTIAFWELNDLGTRIKASDSAYNGTLYNGTWLVPDTASKTISNGLVAFYPFSGNANDSSGGGNNATVTGATLTTDRFGNANSAYNFDGNQYITGSASNYPSANSQRSISIWYNAKNLSDTGFSKLLFGYGGGVCGTSFQIVFENTDIGSSYIGKYEVQGHCLAFRNYTNYPTPINNQWHNIIVTYDGSLLRFYNDGVLAFTSTSISTGTVVSNKIFVIGSHTTTDGTAVYIDNVSKKFIGKIDDVRIYNRVLNTNEITYLSTR